jgi:hypothetical protein
VKRCVVCNAPLYRGGETCSRVCLMVRAEFHDFSMLQFLLINARWAGALSQEEAAWGYFRQRMRAAVRRLGHSEDALVAVLAEIAEEMEGVETVS